MIHFFNGYAEDINTVHVCDRENDSCRVKLTYQATEHVQEDVIIEKCILSEIQELWGKGIITVCCCCGHGNPDASYIVVAATSADKMTAMGYQMLDKRYAGCERCGVFFRPKTV